ncbi:nucleotide sugar dehydrogenase [Saccharomonospora marina XMU15]|uniref:Nucleotide sugar dehydrogenase n=1 Tax=Saccharomonospora marina XMU15 TaxID=882083 RepID=H5X2J3_9PSEU|nr:nucleotide sugar dehydrogenase [Saccharomonospora marina]EHR49858.1 nucleotide sugar dehydrogenase [Saccharomonospora marina XMU15]
MSTVAKSPGRLVVVGQGFVGLPIAMRAVEVGFDVVGVDVDVVRVWSLRDGRSYVEDVTDDELKRALSSGRYRPTDDYADVEGFDAAIITVPTPLRDSSPDLSFIEAATSSIAQHVRPGVTVVLESTTYPGTTEELVVPLLEKGSGLSAGQDFLVGYSPERIDPGNTRWRFANTPKVVSGVDSRSLAAVRRLYDRLVEQTVPVTTPKEAELAKLLENTFRHVNIALVNELAVFAHQLGVDIWEAIDAATTKPFGFMRFTPGPGVGGHCLPVDPTYLSWRVRRDLKRDFRFVSLANDVNDHMPDYVVQRLGASLNRMRKPVNDSTVLLLGLAYKPNTGDIRESPALRITELLTEQGANVQAVDSHVEPHRCPSTVKLVELSCQVVRDADAVVLLTDHDDVDYTLVQRNATAILDTRRRLSGANVEYL